MLDVLLILLSLCSVIIGIIGSVLPILPGPPFSWLGVLLIYLCPSIPFDYKVVIITFIVAAAIFVLDFIIPALGVKRLGGTKAGMYGGVAGMLLGVFIPIPVLGIFIGAFLGAYIAEEIQNNKKAFIASVGSVIGLMVSSVIKIILAVTYMVICVKITIYHWGKIF